MEIYVGDIFSDRNHRSQQQALQCGPAEAAGEKGKLAVSAVQPMVGPASVWGIATVQIIPVVGRGIATVQSALVVMTFVAVVKLSMVVTKAMAVVVVAVVAASALHRRVQKRRTNCSRRLKSLPASLCRLRTRRAVLQW